MSLAQEKTLLPSVTALRLDKMFLEYTVWMTFEVENRSREDGRDEVG